ncbi:DUF1967 domain-containing protein, partial [Candidatus Gracilibacteria bacterium]|nr:DUF1967 domain-containing protein [Candidatus Gracilibacteria bacterium]
MLEEMKKVFEKATKKKVALTLSAGAYIRIDELKNLLLLRIPEKVREESTEGDIPKKVVQVYDLKRQADPKRVRVVKRADGDFDVTGERMEEIARMTDLRYIDGINRVYDVMDKLGVIRKVKAMVVADMTEGKMGFFEGEEDIPSPSVWIGDKKFSLENIIFMKEKGM